MPEHRFIATPELAPEHPEVTGRPRWGLVERTGKTGRPIVAIETHCGDIRFVNLSNLEHAAREEVLAAARRLGEPTPEQWRHLRVGAAELRLATSPLLVEAIDALWPEESAGACEHRRVTALTHLVEDRLLRRRSVELGGRAWNLADLVAREALLLYPLDPRNVEEPDEALRVLVARLAEVVARRTFVPRENVELETTPGQQDGALAGSEARADLEHLARRLEGSTATPDRLVARFVRRPDLWDATRAEQATGLGVTEATWRQAWSRATRTLRAA